MQYETITHKTEAGVCLITLNRPEARNALNAQMRADLTHAFKRAAKEARVIVLTGAAPGFCAGQDLGDGARLSDVDLGRTLRDEHNPMLTALHQAPIPTIAAVNGPAIGAGMALALACDIVIAGDSASFQDISSQVGMIPDMGATYWIPRLIGAPRARAMALLGEAVPAATAQSWGLIWDTAPDEGLSLRAAEIARRLATGPTAAFGLTKEAFDRSMTASHADQLEREAELQARAGRSRDFLEGVLAHAERRPPAFEGR